MRVQKRGRFSTLVHDDGSPVTYVFRTTYKKTTCSKDTLYGHVHVHEEMVHVIEDIDETIRTVASIEYSPYLRGAKTLVVKKSPSCDPLPNDTDVDVEITVKLGNFGSFGYCWTLVRCVAM